MFWSQTAICAFQVGYSAAVVDRHLSPLARAVAGPWVRVLALSKLLMALCAALLMLAYFGVALWPSCSWGFLFCFSLMLSIVFQSGAGVALFALHQRATSHAANFPARAGGWWRVLVAGTFGVGPALWGCGLVHVFEVPFGPPVAVLYLVAAGSQLLAGAADPARPIPFGQKWRREKLRA